MTTTSLTAHAPTLAEEIATKRAALDLTRVTIARAIEHYRTKPGFTGADAEALNHLREALRGLNAAIGGIDDAIAALDVAPRDLQLRPML